MTEVVKVVTAPEFLILQYIHGSDALHKVEEVKNEKINLAKEKDRLRYLYSRALKKKEQSIDNIFGALGNLPNRLPDNLIEQFNLNEEGLTLIDPNEIKKAAKAKNRSEKKTIKTDKEVENESRIANSDEVNVADLMG